ncbi:VOC family protein [Paenibacillus ginsengarvi]|uniref:VOC family protein n=1 Tax=Paenibacillus ginsengarvi TaxID=400777 RepID=A0A3B0CKS0_9BACL|nr:VOC family protein [Paenibacillus ginsengarvi]RKN85570.1 VOC family protein [Paenibacillus ginsengarvi]
MSNGYTPHRYRTVTPYFKVEGAAAWIEFVRNVFGAEELQRSQREDGSIQHAELLIGDTLVEVSDGSERFPAMPSTMHIFVADTDDIYRRALEHGAVSLYEPADMPYGERSGGVRDPFGNHWYIATFWGGEGKGYH